MAPDGGQTGEEVSTVITCEGTLGHPEFPRQFQTVVDRLNGLLGVLVKVRKLEPWNSVRVTLSVPREAALRLRQLAQQGAPQLRALGILSVQLDGEGIISLRLQNANGEPQEVILRTNQDGSTNSSNSGPLGLGSLLPTASGTPGTSASGSQVQFKSPNVVCPPDTVVPRVGANMGPPPSAISSNSLNKPPYAGPFPFASMNQAIQSQSNTGINGSVATATRTTNMELPPPPFLPPPYPGIRQAPNASTAPPLNSPAVTISSPLLVNLLQNDQQVGSSTSVANTSAGSKLSTAVALGIRQMRPPPLPLSTTAKVTGIIASTAPQMPSSTVPSAQAPHHVKPLSTQGVSNHLITSQANVLVNSSNNNLSNSNVSSNPTLTPPSALSTTITLNSSQSPVPNSIVTSTQLAISNIANSLATAANSIAANNSSLTQQAQQQQQQGVFGLAKGGNTFGQANAGQPSIVQHYQRTPQGSIIAVNKPLNQIQGIVNPNSSVPLQQRTNLQQTAHMMLRQQQQQQQPHIPPPKNASAFAHSSTAMLHQKLMNANGPNTNTSVPSGSNVAVPGTNHIMTRNPALIRSQNLIGTQSLGIGVSDSLGSQVASSNEPVEPKIIKTSLPSPPPYNVAISRSWDLMGNPSNILDLAPSLTDLKPDELDELLPTLGHDALPELSELELLGPTLSTNTEMPNNMDSNDNTNPSVPSMNENSTNSSDGRKFLINPLTGELEPHSSGDDSDAEEVKDVFTGLPSPVGMSDEDTNSTTRPDTTTDQSDSETRSSTEGKHSRVKNSKMRREGRDSPAQKEKIKLRLKLEKSEPINPTYKLDYVNAQQPKKASTSVMGTGTGTLTGGEELRVPPLHISLRGRNSAVIKNKINPDGTPVIKKTRKMQGKNKKEDGSDQESVRDLDAGEHKKFKKFKVNNEHKDLLNTLSDMPMSPGSNAISKYSLHNHYKDKQKERRGSDSELVRVNSKKQETNGALVLDEKRRRLSQSEGDKLANDHDIVPSVLGSTNVGTVAVLPQKSIRTKDKIKMKETYKLKDNSKKLYVVGAKPVLNLGKPPSPPDKRLQGSAISLPTASDVDMEAKFKQSLMEDVIGEKGIPRPPHRTVEVVGHVQIEKTNTRIVNVGEKVGKSADALSQQVLVGPKEKSPEPEKCNVERERKSIDSLQDKQLNNVVVSSGGRSPNSGSSGGQGEDSGIESMDALSEKSPNQASQSPHADILPNVIVPTSKSQVPEMLDIEAQLAKMEGLEPHQDDSLTIKNNQKISSANSQPENTNDLESTNSTTITTKSPNRTTEDVNENECIHRSDSKPCCDLTCTLQGGLDQEAAKSPSGIETEENTKTAKIDVNEPPNSPLALRVTPALYSYPSNAVDKGGGGGISQNSRGGSESPSLTTDDEDSNLGSSMSNQQTQQQINNKGKSLLEQLLIEIPNEHHGNAAMAPNSHSPATRSSVRTRALSKLNSPELNSPVPKNVKSSVPGATAKRKRNESDSSNHSVEEVRKRPRKGSGKEASDISKRTGPQINANAKKNVVKTTPAVQQDDSSDSDEPLIEKLRKSAAPKGNAKLNKGATAVVVHSAGLQTTAPASQVNNKSNIRRSARAGQQQQPAQNTRSREKVVPVGGQVQHSAHGNAEVEAALRRKTRSTDVESKRKKEVK